LSWSPYAPATVVTEDRPLLFFEFKTQALAPPLERREATCNARAVFVVFPFASRPLAEVEQLGDDLALSSAAAGQARGGGSQTVAPQ